jgi:hypothetical protein
VKNFGSMKDKASVLRENAQEKLCDMQETQCVGRSGH